MISKSFERSRIKSISLNKSSLLRRFIQSLIRKSNQLNSMNHQNCVTRFWLARKMQIYKLKPVLFVTSQIILLRSTLIDSLKSMRWMTKMNSIILISSQILIQKLTLSSKVIFLCNLNEILSKKNYFEESFLIKTSLIAQNKTFSLRSLINSDFVVYTLIYINLADKICQKLNLQSISLIKKKLIWEYDKKLFQKIITHKILSNLIIEDHINADSWHWTSWCHIEQILNKQKMKYYWTFIMILSYSMIN